MEVFNSYYDEFVKTFFADYLWFPPYELENLHRLPADYPHVRDLLPAVYFAILITLVRYYVIDRIYTWLGCRVMKLAHYSIQQLNSRTDAVSRSKSVPSVVLEKFSEYASLQQQYTAAKKKSSQQVLAIQLQAKCKSEYESVLKQLTSAPHNYTPQQVDKYFSRIKADATRASKLKKFNEAGWRFSFYLFIWLFGFIVLFDKSWFRVSVHEVWRNYPFESPDNDIKYYYYLSLGHYIHLFFSQFFDVKRKDFWEMMIHHVVTILLIVFSYGANFVRVGSLVLLVHDGSDIFMELAKLFNYAKYQTLCDVTFVCFAISFLVCRLIIFPFRIIYTTAFAARDMVGVWFSYYFFNGLLLCLLVLHIFWFSIIVNMVWNYVRTGQVAKDARSDTEEEIDEPTTGDSKKQS